MPTAGEYVVTTHPIALTNRQSRLHLHHRISQKCIDIPTPLIDPLECLKIKSVFTGSKVQMYEGTSAMIGLLIPKTESFLSKLPAEHRLLSRNLYATYEELRNKCIIFRTKDDAESYINHIKNPDGGVPDDTIKDRFSLI